METLHRLILGDAREHLAISDGSVQLVVTSPPYPMIGMWDGLFGELSAEAAQALEEEDGDRAFDRMHLELDRVWAEMGRVLSPGGLLCINVGDATRTIGGRFRIFPNHARIIQGARNLGFDVLPDIVWRKPTNAPNKFMGSGMLPAGAYVTYEHEAILIFRKGGKREFPGDEDKARRRRSAFFWEERNAWFSDVWMDLVGTRQALVDPESRARSAAFPFELAWRLIQMFSLQGDTVLDPFLGTGTSMVAAAATARNSIGVEKDPALATTIAAALKLAPRLSAERGALRHRSHADFVAARLAAGKTLGHRNLHYGFPVVTAQEVELVFDRASAVELMGPGSWRVRHEPLDQHEREFELELPGLG